MPVEKQVQMFIFFLAHGHQFRLVSERFNVSPSTCHSVITKLCAVVNKFMLPRYITWPNSHRQRQIADRYEAEKNFPGKIKNAL